MDRSSDLPWQAFAESPTRRRLLQVAGLGMLGLSLPQLLSARAPLARHGPTAGRARSCIFVVQYGGASHIDTWDVKPDAPKDIRGPYRPIPTAVTGTRIGELLPRLAGLARRYGLVRSMSHNNGDHNGGMHICMTGHSRRRTIHHALAPSPPGCGPPRRRFLPTSGCKTWTPTCADGI